MYIPINLNFIVILSLCCFIFNYFLFLFPFYSFFVYKNTAAISHRCLYYFYSVILNLQINTSHRLGCYNYSLLQHNSLISFCIANFLSNYVINIFFSFRFRFLQQCILRYLHPFHNNHKSTHFSLILQISL